MNPTVKETLIRGKALISNPNKWTRKAVARDKEHRPCMPGAKDAVCFCSIGALNKVAPSSNLYYQTFDVLEKEMDGDIAYSNDHWSHERVMEAWDRAIAKAQ